MAKITHPAFDASFTLKKMLGEGGNGAVYECIQNKTGFHFAVKFLYNKSAEKKERFKREIEAMRQLAECEGVMPIVDANEDEYWYVMPCALPISDYIKRYKLSLEKVIDIVISLSFTLSKIHARGISHRDIKPDNIFILKKKVVLGDFGLCDYDKLQERLTKSDKGIGAIFTIAPEMKRNPLEADGKAADVFSLAKTLWMLLTGDEKGFDGVYNGLNHGIGLHSYKAFRGEHLVEIEMLLEDSTSDNPCKRPTMQNFYDRLCKWKNIYRDDKASQCSDWAYLCHYLFNDAPQETATWTDSQAIVNVLNHISLNPLVNHMLFPSMGGLDLWGRASLAKEEGCIVFNTWGYWNILKPKRLYFQSFKDIRWNYFFLEADELPKVFDRGNGYYEYLVEDVPGHYVSARYAQYGVYDYDSGIPFPAGYREVRRFYRGKFLVVMKSSPYNSIPNTYDGRHTLFSAAELKDYMNRIRSVIIKNEEEGMSTKKAAHNIEIGRWLTDDDLPPKTDSEETRLRIPPENFLNDLPNHLMLNHLTGRNITEEGAMEFSFIIDGIENSWNIDSPEYYLCKDGRIRKTTASDVNIFHVYNRLQAGNNRRFIMAYLKKYFVQHHYDISEEMYCSLQTRKIGNPTHFFTKKEIKDLMRKADDRKPNSLVIDEFGNARLIQDARERDTFPVSQGTWGAGNNNVGKYSDLSVLDESYSNMLTGWFAYLTTGEMQYDTRVARYDDKYLEQEILAYYIRNGINWR